MSNYDFTGGRWQNTTVTWYYGSTPAIVGLVALADGYTNNPYPDVFAQEIQQAFAAWDANSALSFVQVYNPLDANITLGWDDSFYNQDTNQWETQKGGILGQTTWHLDSNGYFDTTVTVRFDDHEVWAWSQASGNYMLANGYYESGQIGVVPAYAYTFYALAAHEIGHALGLDHPTNSSTLMYGTALPSTSGLTPYDIQGIQILYGSAADTTPPSLTNTSPADNATNVAVGSNIVLTFNEAVRAGSNSILIFSSNGQLARIISVTDSSQVTFSGNSVTINPSTDLAAGTGYYVNLDSGAILDIAGNNFAGISGSTAFNFTTATTAQLPDLTASNVTISDSTVEPGQSVTVNFRINNIGLAAAGAFDGGIYLSTDSTISTADTFLDYQSFSSLLSGSYATGSQIFSLPTWLTPGVTYYIGVIADDLAYVTESNEGNNTTAITISVNNAGSSPPVNDFNGDGTSDILWRNSTTGNVGAFEMHNGALTWRGISSTGTSWTVLGTGDVDGDQTTDILVGTVNGGVTYVGYWDMQNSAATAYHYIGAAGSGWSIVGTGDFNGDGTSDILWRNSTTGNVGAFEMHNGALTWRGISSTGTSWTVLGTGDVDGDQTTDILVGTVNGGVTYVGYWDMQNSAATAYHYIGAAGSGWSIVGTGDFNGDGTSDILWRNSTTGNVGAFEMHNGALTWRGISSTGTSWTVLGTGDVDGDQTTDILVGTVNGGVTYVGYWDMQNSAATAYHYIGAAGSGWLMQS